MRLWEPLEVTMTGPRYLPCRLLRTGALTVPSEVATPRVVASVVEVCRRLHIEDVEDILPEDVVAIRPVQMDRACPASWSQLA